MYIQKQKELLKQYEKQEKKLKDLKAGGKSTKQAVSPWLFLDFFPVLVFSNPSSHSPSFIFRRNRQKRPWRGNSRRGRRAARRRRAVRPQSSSGDRENIPSNSPSPTLLHSHRQFSACIVSLLWLLLIVASYFYQSCWVGDDQFGLFYLSFPGVDFGYEGQKPLFRNVDFGIDMESRSKSHMSVEIMTSSLTMVKNIHKKMSFFFCFSMYCWAQWSWKKYTPPAFDWKIKSCKYRLSLLSIHIC